MNQDDLLAAHALRELSQPGDVLGPLPRLGFAQQLLDLLPGQTSRVKQESDRIASRPTLRPKVMRTHRWSFFKFQPWPGSPRSMGSVVRTATTRLRASVEANVVLDVPVVTLGEPKWLAGPLLSRLRDDPRASARCTQGAQEKTPIDGAPGSFTAKLCCPAARSRSYDCRKSLSSFSRGERI